MSPAFAEAVFLIAPGARANLLDHRIAAAPQACVAPCALSGSCRRTDEPIPKYHGHPCLSVRKVATPRRERPAPLVLESSCRYPFGPRLAARFPAIAPGLRRGLEGAMKKVEDMPGRAL
jgi:hypothetical protein